MIDDPQDPSEESLDELEAKKKKKKRTESDSSGSPAERIVITPELSASMARFGITLEQLTRILRDWSPLRGEKLARVYSEFFRDVARASAQISVAFTGTFSIVTDFFKSSRTLPPTPQTRVSFDEKNQGPR